MPDDRPVPDETEAMLIAAMVADTYASLTSLLPKEPPELQHGVLLFFDALMRQVVPLLPKREGLDYLRLAVKQTQATAALIRSRYGMDPVQ